jgi:hypothetical protein
MVYERRIEHSLSKTISELDRMKMLGSFNAEERNRYRDLMYREPGFGGRPATPVPPHGPTTNGPLCKTNPIPAGADVWRTHPAGGGAAFSGPPDSACRVTSAG